MNIVEQIVQNALNEQPSMCIGYGFFNKSINQKYISAIDTILVFFTEHSHRSIRYIIVSDYISEDIFEDIKEYYRHFIENESVIVHSFDIPENIIIVASDINNAAYLKLLSKEETDVRDILK